MSRIRTSIFLCLAALLSGCEAESNYLTGIDLSEIPYPDTQTNAGIHPDTSVLSDPGNPFIYGITGDTNWDVLDLCLGSAPQTCVATFYAWASQLAQEPMGENQFYTAEVLRVMFEQELVELTYLADARDRSIAGYQALLDYFPSSDSCVTATCESRFALGPLAYKSIIALGGTVQGGWFLMEDENGLTHLMRSD
jgi:hypothetical protein